jgi:uracil-DNA glycosylase
VSSGNAADCAGSEVGLDFDPGYVKRPWTTLVSDAPDETVYPSNAFRVEWGPIFHRGRLDGTATILVIEQDPAAHEAICRRILVGEAGQRIQGFLTKLGVTTSYLMINTFLYSVYGQQGGQRHINDAAITAYRNRWIDAATTRNQLKAIVTLGHLADTALDQWKATPSGTASAVPTFNIIHPTYPDSASRSRQPGHPTKAQAMKKLCDDWNVALSGLAPLLRPSPSFAVVKYGATITDAEHTAIPAVDLPAGLPPWMRSLKSWAVRSGTTAAQKRATITVKVPTGFI